MNDGWSKEELQASVEVYVTMLQMEREGQPFVKKRCYDDLAATFGRTTKAFEYRMQNISYVMTLLGRSWVTGLKPAKNVGANIAAEIEAMIAEVEGRQFTPIATFEIQVREEEKKNLLARPEGNRHPATHSSTATQYQRDPAVKARVLRQA